MNGGIIMKWKLNQQNKVDDRRSYVDHWECIEKIMEWTGKIGLGVLTGISTLNGMNPLAPAYFAAQISGKLLDLMVLAGVIGGIFLRMGIPEMLRYGTIMIAIWALIKIGKIEEEQIHKKALITGICTTIVTITQCLWETSAEQVFFQAVTEGFICIGFVVLFGKALSYGKHRCRQIEQGELLGWIVLSSGILASLPEEWVPWFSLRIAAVFTILLIISYRFGMAEGMATGLCLGAVLAYREQDFSIVIPYLFYGGGLMAIPSMGAGLFRKTGRIGSFLAAAALQGGLFWHQELFDQRNAFAIAIGGAVFLFLPKAWVVQAQNPDEEMTMDEMMWHQMKNQLKDFAEAFRRLRTTLLGSPIQWEEKKAKDQVLYHTVQEVCNTCEYCDYCWSREAQASYEQASAVLEAVEQTEENEEIYNYPFFTRCAKQEPFLMEVRHGYEMSKLELLYNERILEGREAVAGQLGQVAEVIDELFSSQYERMPVDEWRKGKIIQELRRKRVKLAEIVQFQNRSGHREVHLTARLERGQVMTVRELGQIISKTIGYSVRSKNGNKSIVGMEYDSFGFLEEPDYYFLQGAAKVSKKKEDVSGDNFSILEYEAGKLGIMIADGMGSGTDASRKSELLIELMERLLEAGFAREAALQLLNAVLVTPVSDSNFSTLDLCMTDLYKGHCSFYKIGAAASFIRRGNQVAMIPGGSIPVGVFPNLEYQSYEKQLKDGDMIFMLSDGVMEAVPALEKEKFIEDEIRKLKTDNPQEAATRLLTRVQELGGMTHRDDITIVAVGVWKRT